MSGRKEEIDEALGADRRGSSSISATASSPHGNAPAGSDPHGELRGQNVLWVRHSIAEVAQQFHAERTEVRDSLGKSAAQLARASAAQRPRPHLDDKIITAWNGLMISAFARAAQVLGDDAYLQAAHARGRVC